MRGWEELCSIIRGSVRNSAPSLPSMWGIVPQEVLLQLVLVFVILHDRLLHLIRSNLQLKYLFWAVWCLVTFVYHVLTFTSKWQLFSSHLSYLFTVCAPLFWMEVAGLCVSHGDIAQFIWTVVHFVTLQVQWVTRSHCMVTECVTQVTSASWWDGIFTRGHRDSECVCFPRTIIIKRVTVSKQPRAVRSIIT